LISQFDRPRIRTPWHQAWQASFVLRRFRIIVRNQIIIELVIEIRSNPGRLSGTSPSF
jgi:hypothetical protein